MSNPLTHLDDKGAARMVDVGQKDNSCRLAVASASVNMKPETLMLISQQAADKGDVLAAARLAGIMAAKKTADLIPLCHQIMLSQVTVDFTLHDEGRIDILSTAKTKGPTGVEMEALTAASVAALTIYDMAKAVDREMMISDIKLMRKEGGKSGVFERA